MTMDFAKWMNPIVECQVIYFLLNKTKLHQAKSLKSFINKRVENMHISIMKVEVLH